MTKDEAMKLALEALESLSMNDYSGYEISKHETYKIDNAITALTEALAEQPAQKRPQNCGTGYCSCIECVMEPAQQEPVVWMYVNKSTHETKFQKHMRDFIDHSLWSEVPLYGEPLANHELQCICGAIWLGDEMVHLPYKRLPPQRTWVGLTLEDKQRILANDFGGNRLDCMDAAERILKEKNNGN